MLANARRILAAFGLLVGMLGPSAWLQEPQGRAAALAGEASRTPLGPLEVVRVVDADTLHVQRGPSVEKLRLLCVDTEERLSGTGFDSGKPETVFGEECALWAEAFFKELGQAGARAKVRLVLPEGRERRDMYGRLLCYVLLPDGRNFNLLLVEQGKSPYFNKYGDSLLFHAEFAAAQARARKQGLGIWNAATNRASTPGAPEARRDYKRLLPWWELRAEAIGEFRALRAKDPRQHAAADEPEQLARAAQRAEPVHVFGAVEELFDERDGSWTILLAADDKQQAVRARIPAECRAAFASLELQQLSRPYRQNFVWITGTLRKTRGFELELRDPMRIRVAGARPR